MSDPGVTRAEVIGLQNKIITLEEQMGRINVDSSTYQEQLLSKILAEKCEEVTGEMGKLHDIMTKLQAARLVVKKAQTKINEVKFEVQAPETYVRLVPGEWSTVLEASLVCLSHHDQYNWIKVETANGYTYDISHHGGMGAVALLHVGDKIQLNGSTDPVAYRVPLH